MKITKQQLKKIIAEELTLVQEGRSIEQIVDDMEESFSAAHKDLQTLALHLKQSGMDFQNVEEQVKALEKIILSLNQSPAPVQEMKYRREEDDERGDQK